MENVEITFSSKEKELFQGHVLVSYLYSVKLQVFFPILLNESCLGGLCNKNIEVLKLHSQVFL